MKAIIIQEKGGVGKSYFAKLLYLKLLKQSKQFTIVDCDNASLSISKFGAATTNKLKKAGIPEKPDLKVYKLLNKEQKIDRTKFDDFLDLLVTTNHDIIADFGAATSEQFLYYAQ